LFLLVIIPQYHLLLWSLSFYMLFLVLTFPFLPFHSLHDSPPDRNTKPRNSRFSSFTFLRYFLTLITLFLHSFTLPLSESLLFGTLHQPIKQPPLLPTIPPATGFLCFLLSLLYPPSYPTFHALFTIGLISSLLLQVLVPRDLFLFSDPSNCCRPPLTAPLAPPSFSIPSPIGFFFLSPHQRIYTNNSDSSPSPV